MLQHCRSFMKLMGFEHEDLALKTVIAIAF